MKNLHLALENLPVLNIIPVLNFQLRGMPPFLALYSKVRLKNFIKEYR